MTRSTKTRRPRPRVAAQATRQRVNQEAVDEMAKLRRQGLTFKEIGARLGCSERTARRYAGVVEPQIKMPPASPAPEPKDTRQLRDSLARWFSDSLYGAKHYPQPRMSVRFMAEATRLIRERLAEMDHLTLELAFKDREMKNRFLKEVVGPLYSDFKWHIYLDTEFGFMMPSESAARWHPPSGRSTSSALEGDQSYDPDEDP